MTSESTDNIFFSLACGKDDSETIAQTTPTIFLLPNDTVTYWPTTINSSLAK